MANIGLYLAGICLFQVNNENHNNVRNPFKVNHKDTRAMSTSKCQRRGRSGGTGVENLRYGKKVPKMHLLTCDTNLQLQFAFWQLLEETSR